MQIRHLYQIAAARGIPSQTLSAALNARAIVAAVGPTCAAALAERGVAVDSAPAHPKMGHMVAALAEYAEARRGAGAAP